MIYTNEMTRWVRNDTLVVAARDARCEGEYYTYAIHVFGRDGGCIDEYESVRRFTTITAALLAGIAHVESHELSVAMYDAAFEKELMEWHTTQTEA